MTRKVDTLGRIVLPVEMREQLSIHPEDELEITLDQEAGAIRLKKAGKTCLRCGSAKKLMDIVVGHFLCGACLEEMAATHRDAANGEGKED